MHTTVCKEPSDGIFDHIAVKWISRIHAFTLSDCKYLAGLSDSLLIGLNVIEIT